MAALRKSEDGPKSSSTKVVDLTDSQSTTRSVSPSELNTLMERLSCKPVYKPDLISKITKTHKVNAERRKAQIVEEKKHYNLRSNKTDEAMKSFRKRSSGISETVDQLMQRIDDGIEEEEEEKKVAYPQITAEHQKTIKYALYEAAPSEVIIEKFNLRITRNDLNTLVGVTWLNDKVINFYMNLLMKRAKQRTDLPKAYCFDTFFIPTLLQRWHGGVRRWTQKVDLFSYDLIPVPVHVGGAHWCMAIIRMKEKIIRYYDSMGNPNQQVLDALERYLIDESMDKRKIALDTSDWKKESIRDCPQQRNGSDCGVFSCMNAEHLTRNAPLKFSQNEMPYFRQKMVLEIATGKLLT
ncbi:sentrin-specific protease 1-like [Culicoides brevitarsis]|uniref:sentrin-specific protease 1-like n=1 Tax=Culicoides brevitarsis TaxID=469753 RepID=UPI00307B3B82